MHGNSLSSSSKPVTADWPFMTSFPFQRGSFLAWICLCENVSRGVTDLRRAGLVWPALGSACPSIPHLRIPELYDPFLSPCKYLFCFKGRLLSYKLVFLTQITGGVELFPLGSSHTSATPIDLGIPINCSITRGHRLLYELLQLQ